MSDTIPQKTSRGNKPANNKRKDDQLGMPHGTACNRLRKQILFHLLQKYDENICFKCYKPIESYEQLSIEHKIPWQGGDTALFWDLDNIAFSHLRCNRPHTPPKSGPEGTAWCYTCQSFFDVENFYRSKERFNGFQSQCKDCRKKTKAHPKAREQ